MHTFPSDRAATPVARRKSRTSTQSRRLVLVACLAGGCLLGTVNAQEFLPVLGGPGGGQFKAPCNAGEMLAGFELRTGDDVDAIRPVCVIATGPSAIGPRPLTTDSGLVGQSGGLFDTPQLAPGWYGGTGGHIERLLCPDSAPVVIGIDVAAEGVDTIVVNNIHLFCAQAAAGQVAAANPSNVFDAPGYTPTAGAFGLNGSDARVRSGSERCPEGQLAVGLHGRSGRWLDAMGLICDAPRVKPAPIALGRVQGTKGPRTSDRIAVPAASIRAAAGVRRSDAVRSSVDDVALNPQPLPPRTAPAVPAQAVEASEASKAGIIIVSGKAVPQRLKPVPRLSEDNDAGATQDAASPPQQ